MTSRAFLKLVLKAFEGQMERIQPMQAWAPQRRAPDVVRTHSDLLRTCWRARRLSLRRPLAWSSRDCPEEQDSGLRTMSAMRAGKP